MCATSAVSDHFNKYIFPNNPIQSMDYTTLALLREILTKLEALDKKLDQQNCSDPEKTKFLAELDERLARLT
jgi:hypothetical protein